MFTKAQETLRLCADDNAKMKEIIVRFDENICEKVSKANLVVFKKNLDNEFFSKVENEAQNKLIF